MIALTLRRGLGSCSQFRLSGDINIHRGRDTPNLYVFVGIPVCSPGISMVATWYINLFYKEIRLHLYVC